jgi:tricarboxylate carrier
MWAVRRHARKVAFGGAAGFVLDRTALHAEEPKLPKFTVDKSLYELTYGEGFSGRFFQMLDVIDPRMLLTPESEIQKAKQMVAEFKEGKSTASDAELWAARKTVDVCVHPVTGDTLFPPGRMSAFVPMNVPICVGMLSAESIKWSMFWQWVNQSYNVLNNYVNRSSESVAWVELGQAYGLACSVSMGMAMTLGWLRQKLTFLNKLGPVVPYSCVVLASSANLMFTRMDEINNGVSVVDKNGDKVGISKEAGMLAIQQTILTRTVCLPILPILLPGIITSALALENKFLKICLETVLVGSAFSVGLPVALAILPQQMEIDVRKLEPELQGKKTKDGQAISVVFANKGL